jgi:hypothetical protein
VAVFISVTTDAFGELLDNRTRPPQINVRRPLRGIQLKEDTYAVLRVKRADGEDIPVFDSSSPEWDEAGIGRSSYYSNFLIQSFQDQRVEKQQIIQTFGEDYIFFFGEQPRFVNVSGVLMNTKDFNWKNEFLENYEKYLRGTRLVEQNARLYLYFDDVVIEGYLVSSTVMQNAQEPNAVQFSFQMFVCQYATLSTVGSVYFQEYAGQRKGEDTGATGLEGGGLAPDTPAARSANAQDAARLGGGSLNSYLARASQFLNNGDISVQRTLEAVRNSFFSRKIVVSEGISAGTRPPLIQNQGQFRKQEPNRPIYENYDEYPERTPPKDRAEFDEAELKRVNEILKLQAPEELERQARQHLAMLGIDTSRRETTTLLLGQGAFSPTQYVASFGVRQAEGELDLSGLPDNIVNL